MWPQQQQPVPLQPGQYPSYSYNNMPPLPLPPPLPPLQQQQQQQQQPLGGPAFYNNGQSPSSELPISIGGGGPSPIIDKSFKRQNDGPILWFAGPPLNILEEKETPVHSLAYLDWKQKQLKMRDL